MDQLGALGNLGNMSEEKLLMLANQLAGQQMAAQGENQMNEEQMNASVQQLIGSFLKTENIKKFSALETAEERLKFIYKLEGYYPLLRSIRISAKKTDKDDVYSRQMRDAGNSAFSIINDEEALDCYNKALLAASADPRDEQGEDMALAFANRSAVLYRQERYQECLRDTSLALKSGYPQHLRYKILQRHAKALCDLGKFEEAKEHFKQALQSLEKSKLNADQRKKIETEVKAAIDAINIKSGLETALKKMENGSENGHDVKSDDNTVIPDKSLTTSKEPNFERNFKFPALHRAVTIKYDRERGRHAVAMETIKAGTYLALEEPITKFLWDEKILNHCTFCLVPVETPVPCYTCNTLIFCSYECRKSAWDNFHQYECKALDGLTSAYQNIFLTYRIIAQKPLKYFTSHKELFSKYDYHRGAGCYNYEYESDSASLSVFYEYICLESGETEPESEDESHEIDAPYRSEDYDNLYNLVTHSKLTSNADHLAYATSACLLIYYLKINNYFGCSASREQERELSDEELFIGKLIYHMLEIQQFNCYDIMEATKFTEEKGIELDTIGCGIYPSLALFNHSCCPNTTRCNIGSKCLVIATNDIKKGQEITLNYNVHFQDKLIASRKKYLTSHFRFDCTCPACTLQWPMGEFMTKTAIKKGVQQKSYQHVKKMFATKCKLTTVDLSVGHYDRVLTMWANYYPEVFKVLEKPNKCYLKIENRIKDVLWLRWGNRGLKLQAPKPRDHRINQRRSSSNANIPQMLNEEEE